MTEPELIERMARAIWKAYRATYFADDDFVALKAAPVFEQVAMDLAAGSVLAAIRDAGCVVMRSGLTPEMVDAATDAAYAARYVNVAGMTPSEVRKVGPRMMLAAMVAAGKIGGE